jgi:hypothetical protein
MADHALQVIKAAPGIQRDGTQFKSKNYIDGQWCRFYEGDPKKIGGYKLIDTGTPEIIREIYIVDQDNSVDAYYGRASSLNVVSFDLNGNKGSVVDRTPLSAFEPNVNNIWEFDLFTVLNDENVPSRFVLASCVPNGNDINNSIPGAIYIGDINSDIPLSPLLTYDKGSAVLINGFVNVVSPIVKTTSIILVNVNTPIGTVGFLTIPAQVAGQYFTIQSVLADGSINSADNSTVTWEILEPSNYSGFVTLVAGGATVNTVATPSDALIKIVTTIRTPSANTGHIYIGNVMPGQSFDIISTDALDASVIYYQILLDNQYTGNAQLVDGEATIIAYNVFKNSVVLLGRRTVGTSGIGFLSVPSVDIVPGQAFTIYSDDFSDNSIVSYQVDNFPVTTGGIVTIGSYLFAYGDDGLIQWSANGNPYEFPKSNADAAASCKIVQGYEARSGGVPGGLFWSLNSLVRCVYNPQAGLPDLFTFDTIQNNISIMSSKSISKVDDMFLWVGLDKFYMYNGLVKQLPNTMSSDYFFRNINMNAREKVYSTILNRYNEWWIFYPRGDATENTHALMYNFAEEIWYDSILPRSCAAPVSTLAYPLMAESIPFIDISRSTPETRYGVWMHEYGLDKIAISQVFAIPSYFETNIMTFFEQSQAGEDKDLRVRRIEPDFKDQDTVMSVIVNKRAYANSSVISSDPYLFYNTTEKIDMNDLGGLVSFRFGCNAVGGDYQMGKTLLNYAPGDTRRGS